MTKTFLFVLVIFLIFVIFISYSEQKQIEEYYCYKLGEGEHLVFPCDVTLEGCIRNHSIKVKCLNEQDKK